MIPLSDGMVVLLSSDAQPSQIIDVFPKVEHCDPRRFSALTDDMALVLEKIKLEYLYNF